MNEARAERIAIKSRGGVVDLRLHQIDWVEANQDYAALHVGAKSWLIRESMHSLALRWATAGFVRIHRSTLLNTDRVRELRPLSKREFIVVLFDGTQLKLSRSYCSAAPTLAGYAAATARLRNGNSALTTFERGLSEATKLRLTAYREMEISRPSGHDPSD